MIALDTQLFSVVEDVGFIRLATALEPRYSITSQHYLTSKILQEVQQNVVQSVRILLSTEKLCGFMTDVWSADGAVASLLSFTVRWLTESFERKTAVLNVTPLDGSHTGEYLAIKCCLHEIYLLREST